MKKWQQRVISIATNLGLIDDEKKINRFKDGSLTADEQKQIYAAYEKEYKISLEDDVKKGEDAEPEQKNISETGKENLLTIEQQKEISSLLELSVEEAPKTTTEANIALVDGMKELKITVETLSKQPEEHKPVEVNMKNASNATSIMLGHSSHTEKHLFGIEHDMFSREKWYNKLYVSRTAIDPTKQEKKILYAELDSYTTQLKSRFNELYETNQIEALDFNKMISGNGTIDYSSLTDTAASVAGEFVIRRTDLIFAFFRSLPSVTAIFPVVSNIQNKEIASSAQFGELSQAYRKGRIFKGSVKFAAEIYSVIDVMFKFQFEDLIDLEKKYIGYLNKEASSIIKWTFIEWLIVNFGKQLINEQNVRRVEGVRVTPQSVVSNPYKFAADGALRAIERVEEELKVLPFEDLGVYSSTTILDYVSSLWEKVVEILPSVDGYKIHANMKHKLWYQGAYAEKYATATGVIVSGQQLPDLHPDNIIWVPNMSQNNYKMWVTIPGTVESYENKPGEMLAFEFLTEFEGVLAKSRWKEGSGLYMAGVKYPSKTDLIASERANQFIFTNYPFTALTLAASVSFSANRNFTITGNTQVDAVTGYRPDVVYKLVASAAAVKLVKGGAFSKIASDFTAAATGDYIKVYAELEDVETIVDGETVTVTQATGKFLELERSVTA